jgi:cyclophilin family peptidyl-prolyl cis-trans isomerase
MFRVVVVIFLSVGSMARAGTLAQFRTPLGNIDVELFDADKPVTVRNFLRYVKSGAYANMFFHRLDPTFVLQGGGFFITNITGMNYISDVVSFGRITNEFSVGQFYSNVYGTIAMAKLPGDVNSASSQFFFNLAPNTFLDANDSNNHFVVFGRVIAGTNILNKFKQFSYATFSNNITDASSSLKSAAFTELPLLSARGTAGDLIYADITLVNLEVSRTNNAQQISWNSVTNRTNYVEFTTNFPPTWQALTNLVGDGSTTNVVDTATNSARRFYRVRVNY